MNDKDYFENFVIDFYMNKINNADIVRIVEDYGISKFMRGLFMYLYNNFDETSANHKYVHISQAYHKSRNYFDEH